MKLMRSVRRRTAVASVVILMTSAASGDWHYSSPSAEDEREALEVWRPETSASEGMCAWLEEARASKDEGYLKDVGNRALRLMRRRVVSPESCLEVAGLLEAGDGNERLFAKEIRREATLSSLGEKARESFYRQALARTGNDREMMALRHGEVLELSWLEAAVRACEEGMTALVPDIEKAATRKENLGESSEFRDRVREVNVALLKALRDGGADALMAALEREMMRAVPPGSASYRESMAQEAAFVLRRQADRSLVPRLEALLRRKPQDEASDGQPRASSENRSLLGAIVWLSRGAAGRSIWDTWYPRSRSELAAKAREDRRSRPRVEIN